MLFLKKRRKISKFSYTICHGARFVLCPGLARLLKQTTLISIERLISTPRLIHFNNLKISQLQRHLHGEGKKWVRQNRQNENATDCDLFFCECTDCCCCCCCCYFCTFIPFQVYYDHYYHHHHYFFISDWLCVLRSRTTMICWHFLYVRTNFVCENDACMCVPEEPVCLIFFFNFSLFLIQH